MGSCCEGFICDLPTKNSYVGRSWLPEPQIVTVLGEGVGKPGE